MNEQGSYCTDGRRTSPRGGTQAVTIFVPEDHGLLHLKAALPWEAIREAMEEAWRGAGKNVDGGSGQAWPVGLYVPLLVLMLVRRLNSREMEWYVSESAVARVFCGLDQETAFGIRDHANIARAMAGLGTAGVEAVNRLVIGAAVRHGFGDPKVMSGDTTAQELPIGYPHEAGILGGLAQRCVRAVKRVQDVAGEVAQAAREAGEQVLKSVKEYHLFAQGKAAKDGLLRRMLEETHILLERGREVVAQVAGQTGSVARGAVGKLKLMQDIFTTLRPQIEHWLETGKVAAGKILHAGIHQARSIVRNKTGKKVEFGLKYLIQTIGGGYVFGTRVTQANDSHMPRQCLTQYRKLFGDKAKPDLLTYDRGGWAQSTLNHLKKAKIHHIGIQPKGQSAWLVDEDIRAQVKSERARMEGRIGTLKSTAYGFNRPRQRSLGSLEQAGQCSFLALNLNLFWRDLLEAKKNNTYAAA